MRCTVKLGAYTLAPRDPGVASRAVHTSHTVPDCNFKRNLLHAVWRYVLSV